MDVICYVVIPGNDPGKRMGLVKWYEMGYYPSDYDLVSNTDKQAHEHVNLLNQRLGISEEVAESAMAASMFGWHIPAAKKAIEFFKQQNQAATGAR